MNNSKSRKPGKDEMNLAVYPIGTIGVKDKRDVLEYYGMITENGNRFHQRWVVRGAAGIGLPTEFAERVLISLVTLTARSGFVAPKTTFSIYKVLKMIDLKISNRNYDLVKKALKQLASVTIESEDAWWDHQEKRRVTTTQAFHIIDQVWIKTIEGKGDEKDAAYIIWNDMIWDSFKAGYIKNLDINFYYGLDNPVARRLYRLLDKYLKYQNSWEIDLYTLVRRLGMREYKYPAHMKNKLKPALTELIEKEYLLEVEYPVVGAYTRIRFHRTKKSDHLSLFEDKTEEEDKMEEPPIVLTPLVDQWNDAYLMYETTEDQKFIWMEVLSDLRYVLPDATYEELQNCRLLTVKEQSMLLGYFKNVRADWLQNRIGHKMIKAMTPYLENVTEVEFVKLET